MQAARIAAQMRANDYARVIVDEPLDDPDLGTVPRQQAAIRALELLYPQVTATLDVELPADEEGVSSLDWEQLDALARTHLGASEGQP